MPKFDAGTAECLVYTYKDGLLSAVAHDLQIRVTDFHIDIDPQEGAISGRFDARSLRVVSAVKDGRPTDALGDKDKKEIEKTIAADVLHPDKHSHITFTSSGVRENNGGMEVRGTLQLHGTEKTITFPVREIDGNYVADVPLHQPDFGIKPYSAMMGTLKIKPEVRVVVKVPTAPPG